ncbi:MAG: hypothetical protein FWG44_07095 [Oscillospiraceae bacterium]|nr:hypothetical protein [Oscillospiraceae bacterium]
MKQEKTTVAITAQFNEFRSLEGHDSDYGYIPEKKPPNSGTLDEPDIGAVIETYFREEFSQEFEEDFQRGQKALNDNIGF